MTLIFFSFFFLRVTVMNPWTGPYWNIGVYWVYWAFIGYILSVFLEFVQLCAKWVTLICNKTSIDIDLIMKLIDIGTDKLTGTCNHQIELKRGKNDSDPFHLSRIDPNFFFIFFSQSDCHESLNWSLLKYWGILSVLSIYWVYFECFLRACATFRKMSHLNLQ